MGSSDQVIRSRLPARGHVEHLNRNDARLGPADKCRSLPAEMTVPALFAGMEQGKEPAAQLSRKIRTFGPVAFRISLGFLDRRYRRVALL